MEDPVGWTALVLLFLIALVPIAVFVGRHALRKWRRDIRREILGLGNGPRFRCVDAMCHAAWSGGTLRRARLERALEIARGSTDMNFTADHLREAATRCDRIIRPVNFRWMREGLNRDEKMAIFNAATSVSLADGPLDSGDRTFLRHLTRGLGLDRRELRDLSRLIEG